MIDLSKPRRRGFMDDDDRLTQSQYATIGKVAVLWAEAEWAMERILVRLALVPSLLGYVLTDKLGPDNRIGAIYSLIEVHRVKYPGFVEASVLTEIEEYLPSISTLKGDRNYIIHSVWAKASEHELSRFDIAATARSGIDIEIGACQSVKSIEDFSLQVQEAATLLWELGSRLPMIDAASLNKLSELERANRHRPGGAAVRQVQPRSFAQLQRKPAQPKQGQKAKPA